MKIHFKTHYLIYLFGISMFFIFSCTTAKYSAEFKKDKKGIYTLTIFNSIVRIVSKNNKGAYIDSTLRMGNQEFLDRLTTELLLEKYKIQKAILPVFDTHIFTDLFKQRDSSKKLLKNISAEQILSVLNLEYKNKNRKQH